MKFESSRATAEVIRDDADYSGIRITLDELLSRAAVRLHTDINFGDPIGAGARLMHEAGFKQNTRCFDNP